MDPNQPQGQKEKDFEGPAWKHPYVIYIGLVLFLFGFLLFMAWMAVENEWIPSRGIGR